MFFRIKLHFKSSPDWSVIMVCTFWQLSIDGYNKAKFHEKTVYIK